VFVSVERGMFLSVERGALLSSAERGGEQWLSHRVDDGPRPPRSGRVHPQLLTRTRRDIGHYRQDGPHK
jgi:hypothetical protein